MTKQEKQDRKNARLRVSRGCFKVSMEFLQRHPAGILSIFRGLLVTDAHATYHDQIVTYYAMSRHFDPIRNDSKAPLYEVFIKEGREVKWRRAVEMKVLPDLATAATWNDAGGTYEKIKVVLRSFR